jgi:TorA maturation chaperone TorD
VTADGGTEAGLLRAATYRLLARLTLDEVGEPLVGNLASLPYLGEAFAASGGVEALPALRAEYARQFVLDGQPYESALLDPAGLLNTDLSASVVADYRRLDYVSPIGRRLAAPDHLGLELDFMGFLAEAESAALTPSAARMLRDEQREFLRSHLVRWGPVFGDLLAESAAAPLYQALGVLLRDFLLNDFDALQASDAEG